MTEDIKLADIHNELTDVAVEPKSLKKIHKLTEKLLVKVNGRVNAERSAVRKKLDDSLHNLQRNIDTFVKNSNESFDKFRKRYEAMYTDLVRRILVGMEGRVFNLEIYQQAALDQALTRIYELEKQVAQLRDPTTTMIDFEQYIKDAATEHEGLMQKHANIFADKMKAKEEEEIKKNVAIQKEEDKDQDSTRGKDASSSETSEEDNGTSN